jgi:hypothetical protein
MGGGSSLNGLSSVRENDCFGGEEQRRKTRREGGKKEESRASKRAAGAIRRLKTETLVIAQESAICRGSRERFSAEKEAGQSQGGDLWLQGAATTTGF